MECTGLLHCCCALASAIEVTAMVYGWWQGDIVARRDSYIGGSVCQLLDVDHFLIYFFRNSLSSHLIDRIL